MTTHVTTAIPRRDPSTGKWGFVVDVVGDDGRRHQARRRGFDTKKDAQAALDAIRTSVRQESYIKPSKMTVRQFVHDKWIPGVKVKLAQSTVASYRRNLDQHVLPANWSPSLGASAPRRPEPPVFRAARDWAS